SARECHMIRAERAGYLTGLDAALVGRASLALGAGRDRVDDIVDPAAGVLVHAAPGDLLSAGDIVLELRYHDRMRLGSAIPLATRALQISEKRPGRRRLILGETSSDDR